MANLYDIVIIGGGPAGLSAGIYTARAKFNAVLMEKLMPGGQVLLTDVIENYPGFEKAITGNSDYDEALLTLVRENKDTDEIYEALILQDIGAAADILRPMYEDSRGEHGYVSLEVSPYLAHDEKSTVAEAQRLFATVDRPNVMIKVPATKAGITAVRNLIGQGININITLMFSMEHYEAVAQAFIDGLYQLKASGGKLEGVASVASFFVSRVDSAVDKQLTSMGDAASDFGFPRRDPIPV